MAEKKPASGAKVKDLTLKWQAGTEESEVLATWSWNYPHTKEFSYKWEYEVGTKRNGKTVWFLADSGTTDASHKNSLYSPPANAKHVRISVKPISTTYKKDKKDTNYWIVSSYTKSSVFKVTKEEIIVLDTPGTPTIEVQACTISLGIENYAPPLAADVTIRFQLVDGYQSVQNVDCNLVYNAAMAGFTVSPGTVHRGRVRAITSNPKYQSSPWSDYTTVAYSSPKQPTISSVRANSSTGVELTISEGANATSYEVQYSQNRNALTSAVASDEVQSVTFDDVNFQTKTFLINGLETGKHWYFKIRANNDGGSSPYSGISDCILGEPPNAPTIWASSYALEDGKDVILYWTHNTVDGSKEETATIHVIITYADVARVERQIVVVNESSDPEKTTFSYRINPKTFMPNGTPLRLRFRVRTKGILPEHSPWSITNDIEYYPKPNISLRFAKQNLWYWDNLDLETGNIYETTGEITDFYEDDPFVMTSFPLYVFAYVYPEGLVNPVDVYFSITAEESYETLDYMGNNDLVSEGEEVWRYSMSTPNLENNRYMFWILPNDLVLENQISYRFYARAVMDTGMIAECEYFFTTDFSEDQVDMNAETTYDEEFVSMYIAPYCLDQNGNPYYDALYLSVYRQNYDGQFVEIARDLEAIMGITVVDPHPTLRYVKYRIAVMSINGTMSFTDLAGVPVPETAIVLQWDEAWSDFDLYEANSFSEPVERASMLKLPFNVDTSESNAIDSEMVEYIGRRHPVSYFGTQVGQKMSLATDIVATDRETVYQLRRLAVWLGNVYVREPTGHGYWAKVDVSFSKTHLDVKIPVKIECTRVEGGM